MDQKIMNCLKQIQQKGFDEVSIDHAINELEFNSRKNSEFFGKHISENILSYYIYD